MLVRKQFEILCSTQIVTLLCKYIFFFNTESIFKNYMNMSLPNANSVAMCNVHLIDNFWKSCKFPADQIPIYLKYTSFHIAKKIVIKFFKYQKKDFLLVFPSWMFLKKIQWWKNDWSPPKCFTGPSSYVNRWT